jgi:hypothetical protein
MEMLISIFMFGYNTPRRFLATKNDEKEPGSAGPIVKGHLHSSKTIFLWWARWVCEVCK